MRGAILFLIALFYLQGTHGQTVHQVDAVGITVPDMNRALDFFTRVLPFEKISETELYGTPYEK